MRHTSILLLAAAAVLAVPPPASAQTGGSLLWLARVAGRLEMERETRGSLSASDHFGPDDAFIDVWEIEGRAGESVTIDMKSTDFDALLYLVGPGLAATLADDDGAGRCDARITVRFLEDGVYRVAATVTSSRTTGVYTLFATATPEPPSGVPCGGPDPAAFLEIPPSGRIQIGETVSGSLDASDAELEDGSFGEAWQLAGSAGQTVRIRLESDAFDAFLYLVGPGLHFATDDDSGGDLDAEIVFTVPTDGDYRIIVSSTASQATGSFRLSVTQ